MSLMPCSRRRARIGQVCPPLTANRYLTPSEPRTPATSAPPSTLATSACLASLGPDSPAMAAPAALPRTTPESASVGLPSSAIACLQQVLRSAFLRGKTISQDAMLDLAGRGARHLMLADEGDRARALVSGDPLLAPR